MADWGLNGTDSFVSTHQQPEGALDTSRVKLPRPFVVCVVGASRGIGAAVATSFAEAGASGVVLASRRVSGLEETAAKCKTISSSIDAHIVPCDITSAASVAALAEETQKRFGRLDVLVVNSGYSGNIVLKVTDADPEEFSQVTDVNYIGTFLCAKYFMPLLLECGGAKTLVAVGSFAAMIVRGPIANTQYCISKLAQLKLIEHIHEQYHEQGLVAVALHPGAVLSEMAEETAPEDFKQYLTDSPALAGAFSVWLTKDIQRRSWLSGRQLSACWDVDELEARKQEIIEKDLLKLKLSM